MIYYASSNNVYCILGFTFAQWNLFIFFLVLEMILQQTLIVIFYYFKQCLGSWDLSKLFDHLYDQVLTLNFYYYCQSNRLTSNIIIWFVER